ncbi:acetolactate synthase, large subunit [Actinopolyspora xinjiangensis]|uniref:Acetolactate synthase n=1 Tax=Actinopolyspora xinjiangensis TaxID=405564 RepID=A0A1H0QLJ5_9ACTN|nr:biosynthetic-type acetolactate synthase large subunit [Actinopolyspora xinjiangensis]SDP18243.1 acetolactate synthase, large subunit [Actinopolyspora xinjiangensis]
MSERRSKSDRDTENSLISGASALVRALEEEGVEEIFGIPGGAILPFYDALFRSRRIRHVLTRHEQAAGYAATGYAAVSGRVGVCVATSGPGATNLITPIADAFMDSVPVVAITGQVPTDAIGTQAFQETDVIGITKPITKWNHQPRTVREIPEVVRDAFDTARSGRPGPVLIDIPKDVLQKEDRIEGALRAPPEPRSSTEPPSTQGINHAAELLLRARRPVLYVGGGVVRASAQKELERLAELTNAPVTTTLTARGAFPDSQPRCLGMPGMHGSVAAVYALQRSDLLVALGTRFDDRVTGELSSFAPKARVVHADIDPDEIGRKRAPDVGLLGDVANTLRELLDALRKLCNQGDAFYLDSWWEELDGVRSRFPLGWEEPLDGKLSPQHVIKRLGELARQDTIFTLGVGQHQMWAAQLLSLDERRRLITSGGLGAMGYAIPAGIGAKLASPHRTVWVIDGDGCLQMTGMELITCVLEKIPVKVAVIDNDSLGMVRQWQNLFYGERYSDTDLYTHQGQGLRIAELAEAVGCVGIKCETPAEIDSVITRAEEIVDRPVVIDFVVSKQEMVWPMVEPGKPNDEIMVSREFRPRFDAEE